MKEETKSTITCIVDGCGKPGTRHANHDNASCYCEEHGICGRCKESVEYFVHIVDQGISPKGFAWTEDTWMCPCAAEGRHPSEKINAVIVESKAVVAVSKKKTVQDYWHTSVPH